jgi:hypothetical protein
MSSPPLRADVAHVDAAWTAGDCTPIGAGATLPIFCVQQ